MYLGRAETYPGEMPGSGTSTEFFMSELNVMSGNLVGDGSSIFDGGGCSSCAPSKSLAKIMSVDLSEASFIQTLDNWDAVQSNIDFAKPNGGIATSFVVTNDNKVLQFSRKGLAARLGDLD